MAKIKTIVIKKSPLKNHARESMTNMPFNVTPLRFLWVDQKIMRHKRAIKLKVPIQSLPVFLGNTISVTTKDARMMAISTSNEIRLQSITGNILGYFTLSIIVFVLEPMCVKIIDGKHPTRINNANNIT